MPRTSKHETESCSEELQISRRTLLKGLAAVGAGVAFLSTGLGTSIARASYGSYVTDLPPAKLIDMYDKMLKARLWDLEVAERMVTGRGYAAMVHICVGEEAVGVGAVCASEDTDWIYASHRNTMHDIARGMDMGKMAAETIYKATGYNKGYGNHFHICDPNQHVAGIMGLIGVEPMTAAGTAFGIKVKGSNQVVLKFSGDGDYQQGDTLAALNEAAHFKLPIVYIIENNTYQIWARLSDVSAVTDLAVRAHGFGMPSEIVDGQDVLAVYAATKRALDRARAGEGPTLIECKTYRYFDHAGAGGFKVGSLGAFGLNYRSDREVRAWMAKDPIERHRRFLLEEGAMTDAELRNLEARAKEAVQEAWAFADRSPSPVPEDGLKYGYVEDIALPRQLPDCPLY